MLLLVRDKLFSLSLWNITLLDGHVNCVFMSSAGSLLLHLLDWVRLHKADVDEKAKRVLQSESPAEHQDYWDVVSTVQFRHLYSREVICNSSLCQKDQIDQSSILFSGSVVGNLLFYVLSLDCVGGELCDAGQDGGSQTDACEANNIAACCQEHVHADGLPAQQDALL